MGRITVIIIYSCDDFQVDRRFFLNKVKVMNVSPLKGKEKSTVTTTCTLQCLENSDPRATWDVRSTLTFA